MNLPDHEKDHDLISLPSSPFSMGGLLITEFHVLTAQWADRGKPPDPTEGSLLPR